ncbi:MAG: flagellar hook-associated protein FlgK [Holophagaceae bacterium]|nr:flagellar hook-associated protein FlgK [Holophagaceae bacterium]
MPGLNASLYLGLSGLQAQQAALNVVGHNIANVNTPGYTRQRAGLSAGQSQVEGQIYFGTGVTLSSVQGIRDRFLDLQIYRETAKQTGADERYAAVNAIASALGDTGSTGIAAQIQAFFQGFQDLSTQPESAALRTSLLGKAQAMVTGLQTKYQLLEDQRGNADQSIGALVAEVNTLTGQIARLNQRISTEATPGADNDARDQRKTLTDKLAGLVGINVAESSDGEYQITLDSGSAVLVTGISSLDLVAKRSGTGGTLQLASDMNGTLVEVTSDIKEGALGAKLDLRDNILVGFQAQLDQIAAGLAGQVNLAHQTGLAADGSLSGQGFFLNASTANDVSNGLPVTLSAAPATLQSGPGWSTRYKGMVNLLTVNAALVRNPSLIAAASAGGAKGDNTNALRMAAFQDDPSAVDTGSSTTGFTSAVAALVTDLGSQTQNYKAQSTAQQNLVSALQSQRDSISGVNLDEEASNMMTLQRGYQASARFISVINQLTDQLVNQFGR